MAIVARFKWINQFYQAHDNFPVDQYYEFTEQHQVFFGKRPILFAALTSLAVFSKRDPLQPLRLLLLAEVCHRLAIIKRQNNCNQKKKQKTYH